METTQRLYDSVLEKVKQASIASALGGANIRVIDGAIPPRLPYSPNAPLAASLGFALATLGGIGLVIANRRSVKVSQPGDLAFPEARELGVIPAAKHDKELRAPRSFLGLGSGNPALELATWQRENSLFAESFRATVASLLFSLPGRDRGPEGTEASRAGRALVITSAEPMEGKTTVITNLAIACAETGRKVLLMDCDLRRPRLHDIFGVCNDSGVADIIRSAGNASSVDLRAYTRSTSVPNLWVLPSGPGVDGVSGLFHSAALTDLLERCRNEFDLTLADSPPMSLYPDARMLGKISDGAVLVVRADRTSREELVRTCYQVLVEDGTNIQGTILNGYSIEPTRHRAYTDSYRRYRRLQPKELKKPTMPPQQLRAPAMPKDRFLRLIEETLNQESGALQGPELLRDTKEWDSMAVVDFMALVDQHVGAAPSVDAVSRCATFDDLYALIES